ncbi:3'(2'),5'-bisphosphate nucleotidase 1 [Phlebotomus argentipes]|uniref:3'(2'),5'-bisphosphate nucleotidase 1 n=1 Tax=Phlebotomus argentipes TaxID=94469 RepID=UPI0028938045|nr:3'(2'),5'-bisphosphate nucleotidase 1 [Phlebotomus argentipes]
MAQHPLLMRVVALSINAANRAGEIIREVMNKGELGIVDKGKDDLQTEADRSAQRCIVASLSNHFPKVKVIGEEGNIDLKIPQEWLTNEADQDFLRNKCPDSLSNVSEDDLVIWVDPLDGTSEYTQGFLEHVTVLIGVSVNERAVGGVIHQPYFKTDTGKIGRTIWGVKELGIGGINPAALPENKFIVTTTRSHSNALVQSALDALTPDEVLRVGGAGYKIIQLLEGKAHAYVFASAGCKKWDTCAPEAVLEANGGTLTDMMGNHYLYGKGVSFPNKGGVLATAKGVNYLDVLNKIPAHIKEEISKKL